MQRDLAPVCPTRNASFSTRSLASQQRPWRMLRRPLQTPAAPSSWTVGLNPTTMKFFQRTTGGVEIPWTCIVRSPEVVEDRPHGQRFRDPAQLAALLAERGVSSSANKIAACSFGIGAAVAAIALEIVGCGPSGVYAGSLIDYVQAHRSR